MITLLTGVPGAGKTLNTIQKVVEECEGRKIYYRGIRDLTLDWEEISDEECLKWYDYPDGAVFVFDEVQQVWPNRSANKPIPESVSRLDMHRHRGFDFYIITQKPTMVDFGVRGFCGRHYHFERAFNRNGTRQLEFQQAVNDPNDYHTRQDAETSRLKFNKKYFDVYKSAEVHTHKPRIPKKFWYFLAALLGTAAAGAYAYTSISERQAPKETDQIEIIPAQSVRDRFQLNEPGIEDMTYIEKFTPRIKDLPFSAPVYDTVTEIKTYPRPQCMYRHKNDQCHCYTQQATPLDISYQQCMSIVESGWFNPFKDESIDGGGAGGQALAPSDPEDRKPSTNPSITFIGGSKDPQSTYSASNGPEPRHPTAIKNSHRNPAERARESLPPRA